MASETSPPACEPPAASSRGRGRGGRGGRGRGRGGSKGVANASVSKPTTASRGRGATRRGRVKNFSDSRVQAAYERQRDLKANYQAVALALKPALQELAERTVDDMLQRPDSYKLAGEHVAVVNQLQDNLDHKVHLCDQRLEYDLEAAKHSFQAEQNLVQQAFEVSLPSFGSLALEDHVTFSPCHGFHILRSWSAADTMPQSFQNAVEDMFETFYEGQENRLRILAALHARGLPVDVSYTNSSVKTTKEELNPHPRPHSTPITKWTLHIKNQISSFPLTHLDVFFPLPVASYIYLRSYWCCFCC